MSLLLSTDSLAKSYGSRLLFKDISISFDDADRTGLIGPNGAGKSTLLKILAGLEHADAGTTTTRRQLKVGYLPQEDQFAEGATVESVVVDAQDDDHIDEHEKQIRAAILLGKIGFDGFSQAVDTLSGGWRKRLSIARQLIRQPDLLLLDEPTNHLDLEGILWLEKLLASAPFAFVLISHDRYFLENTCNRTVELSRAYADGYLSINGSYSDFLAKREEYLTAQQSRETALASRVRREIEWLKRGAKARTTKAKGRIDQAGKLMGELSETQSRNAAGGAVQIDFAATERKTRKLLEAKHVAKSLGGRTLFRDLSVVLSPGSKLGLLGPNGSGKSTLIRLLAGETAADAGEIFRADGLRIVLFDQARAQLDRSMLLRRSLSPHGDTLVYQNKPMHVAGWARRFLFRTDQLDLPVGELSGGEQARVLIAQMMLRPADLLILDEPTNDLDIPSLEVLEESLSDFPGALVLVTHDRYMLDRVSTELLALDGAGGANFYADLSQWQRAREAAEEAELLARRQAAAKSAKPAASPPGKKKLTYMEQRELEGIEAKILQAEEQLHARQSEMSDPKVLANRDKLHTVCEQADAAQREVTQLYARWQALEAKKDGA